MAQAEKLPAIEGIDFEILDAWMDEQGLPPGEIGIVDRLVGGTENILIRFERGGSSYVLRRPPLDKRAGMDESMRREAQILEALAGSDVPHPAFIAGCADEAVLGAAFYLMEPVDGFNASESLPELHAGDSEIRRQMGFSMVDGIAALSALDYRAVGLEGLGRPEGYLELQVSRWRHQLESYAELEGYAGPKIPGVERVADWLESNRPDEFEPGILHGDYQMANVLFSFDGPELAAIVDWEVATVGDPLVDLGALLAGWPDVDGSTPLAPLQEFFPDLPDRGAMHAHYAQHTTRNVDAIDWYTTLGCFRLAIVLEGAHARACAGHRSRDSGDRSHAASSALIDRALSTI